MTTTVSLIKKKFKRMKWSLFLKRGVLRVTRTKRPLKILRAAARTLSLSFFLSFFLSHAWMPSSSRFFCSTTLAYSSSVGSGHPFSSK